MTVNVTESEASLCTSSLPAVDADLSWGVCDRFDRLPFGREEWDSGTAKLGGSVYMTWDWLHTWWQFYGDGCQLRLFWFRKDGALTGLLPFYVRQLGFGPFRLTVARLVGANIPPKVFDPPLHPDCLESCLTVAMASLLEEGCDVVSLGPVSQAHPTWGKVARESNGPLCQPRHYRQTAGVHTIFQLASSYEEYLKRLGKNEQKNRRKYELRLLGKEFAVRLQVLRDPGSQWTESFERFAQLHTQQWKAEGLLGHFGAWPRGLEYNRALVRTLAAHGRVRIMELWAGDQHVAGQYAFAFADRWYWELPARIVGPQWERFSLGPTALMLLLVEAMREGCSRVEGGLGHYEYKLRLGGREHPVWNLRFLAPGGRSALRRLSAGWMQNMLRLGYYKVWYRRVQPHLPESWKRPLWGLWLRHDY
ncbi:MAG: GNAT family N-acetyltransferase [Verrucomicrobiota bacterium]|nr:GNAT family N-acetyltransferase [Limisphaera sp.]MDW8380818.1 GNAT family N-acetyltransferase [Verrucomicrobiota bacterium]